MQCSLSARAPLKLLCDTMKYQIISRAFYGCEFQQVVPFTFRIIINSNSPGGYEHLYLSTPGLAYCRHLSTVRTHLSALVNTTIVDPVVPFDAQGGLSVEVWGRFLNDNSVRVTP